MPDALSADDHARRQHARNGGNFLRRFLNLTAVDINDRVCQAAARLVEQIGDVDLTLGQRRRDLADHVRHVLVDDRSEEHTSELQSLMRISYAVFCLKKKKKYNPQY